MTRKFLTAKWHNLIMLNYEIDPDILQPLVPQGTELDTWNGRTYVSFVAFQFLNTRVLGLPIPFHINFEEVNLRFYVRRQGPEGWRRGVVFIKELVPRWAIALVARRVYNENYKSVPMHHAVKTEMKNGQSTIHVAYGWYDNKQWQGVHIQANGQPAPLVPDSEEAFITEHYWGYSRQQDGSTVEYQVEHPPWQVWSLDDWQLDLDTKGLYGAEYVAALSNEPCSAFMADGSAVAVYQGVPI